MPVLRVCAILATLWLVATAFAGEKSIPSKSTLTRADCERLVEQLANPSKASVQ